MDGQCPEDTVEIRSMGRPYPSVASDRRADAGSAGTRSPAAPPRAGPLVKSVPTRPTARSLLLLVLLLAFGILLQAFHERLHLRVARHRQSHLALVARGRLLQLADIHATRPPAPPGGAPAPAPPSGRGPRRRSGGRSPTGSSRAAPHRWRRCAGRPRFRLVPRIGSGGWRPRGAPSGRGLRRSRSSPPGACGARPPAVPLR